MAHGRGAIKTRARPRPPSSASLARERLARLGRRTACANAAASRGTPPAAPSGMATKTKPHSEAWTVPLHIVVWTTMIVGLIMVFVVLLMH